jgi:SprT protein
MLKIKHITEAQKKLVESRVRECFDKFFPGLSFSCPIYYRSDMRRVAGIADCDVRHIELNETLLSENFDKFMVTTIPHEVAHLITREFYPNAKQNHGPEFRQVCVDIGYPDAGRTYADYNVESVYAPKPSTKHVYECVHGCHTYKLSKLIHNKIQNGQVRRCGECKTVIKYTHETITV